MPKGEFKQEVEKELTGRETEPWEIIYFKLYQSQMPVIERAIEAAALMCPTPTGQRSEHLDRAIPERHFLTEPG